MSSHVEVITDDDGEVIATVHGPRPLTDEGRAAMRALVDAARDMFTEDNSPTPCAWFALCTNAATATRAHPTLGQVPICDRCNAKVDAIGGDRG